METKTKSRAGWIRKFFIGRFFDNQYKFFGYQGCGIFRGNVAIFWEKVLATLGWTWWGRDLDGGFMMNWKLALNFVLPLAIPMALGAAIRGLGTGPYVETDLAEDLKSEDEEVREEVLSWMSRIRRTTRYEDLLPLLEDPSADVREDVVDTLGKMTNPNALPAMDAAIDDELTNVEDVVFNMAKIGYPQAIPYFEKRLDHPDQDVADEAKEGIIGIRKSLNQEVCFYSLGHPIYNRLGEVIYSQAILFPPGRELAREEGRMFSEEPAVGTWEALDRVNAGWNEK